MKKKSQYLIERQIIKLRHQKLSIFQIASKVELTVDSIRFICKKVGLGGQWLKNMRRIEEERLNKEEVKRRNDFIKKQQKQSLIYEKEKRKIRRCLNTFKEPIAQPNDVSLKQRRLKEKYQKVADEIIRSYGYEPDKR